MHGCKGAVQASLPFFHRVFREFHADQDGLGEFQEPVRAEYHEPVMSLQTRDPEVRAVHPLVPQP